MCEMMEKFDAYLTERNREVSEEAQKLIQEERADEARFLKAKANIFDVFKSLFRVSCQQAEGDTGKCDTLFLDKAKSVPMSWQKALTLAKEHGDTERILMEETKLSAVEEILEIYEVFKAEGGDGE